MVGARDAAAYSKRKPLANTRHSKKQQYSYIKVVPPQKVVKFNMGNIQDFNAGKYGIKVTITSGINVQIRDLAIEAVRQSLHKDLSNFLVKNYFLRCNIFPHNVLRNNRVFSGASKGERVQTGMTLSFGTSEGRAAVVKKGGPIFTIYFNGIQNLSKVKSFIKKVTPKLPCATKVRVEFLPVTG